MYFDISIASVILVKSSLIKTISLASIALSVPTPPIEIPMSALFKTGASFMPSPTNIVISLYLLTRSKFSNLSVGNISYLISSISNLLPISRATSFLSPVNIYVLIPLLFSFVMTDFASFLIPSSIMIDATCSPSIFKCKEA